MQEDQFRLLYKKLTEEISQSENVAFESWLNDSSENELLFRRMKDAWNQDQYSPKIKGQKATFERISKQLDFEEELAFEISKQSSAKIWKSWHRVAAVIIIFMTFSAIAYFSTNSFESSNQIAHSNYVIKFNPAGQKARINLPDGTVCWLNSESEIQYLSNFSDSARNIQLLGEAYFEVAKDPDKPFRVHTSTMTITALGTIFNVTSFPEDSKETVALVEGKIEVKCANDFFPKVLPGEAIQFDRSTKLSTKLAINVNDYVAWKNGELIFEELNFETMLAKLERWYGVKITVSGNPPESLKYRAKFRNQILINVLESMKYGHEFEYTLDGKHVEIMFN
jgi:transmembrane sensor